MEFEKMEFEKKYDHKKTVIINTGKVLIGCAYQPPPAACDDDDEYVWQNVMLNDKNSVRQAFKPVMNVFSRVGKIFGLA